MAARKDGKPNPRNTDAVIKLRVTEVYGLLSQAYSRTQILRECSEKWDISERQVENYIAKARVLLEKDCELSRAQFLAELMQRLRTYENKAAQRGQMQVAVNSARLQAELVSLTD